MSPSGPVVQWLEPSAHNGVVAGSSPARITTFLVNQGVLLDAFCFVPYLFNRCARWNRLSVVSNTHNADRSVPLCILHEWDSSGTRKHCSYCDYGEKVFHFLSHQILVPASKGCFGFYSVCPVQYNL